MQDGEWYFDSEDSTVSVTSGDLELEICKVANFDLHESSVNYGGKYYFGEKSKANAALLTSAPALLEALEGLYQMVQENYHVDDSNMKFINDAYAAIAAARGTV